MVCHQHSCTKSSIVQSGGHVTGAQTLQLRDNYRSTPQVLRGAEGVLKNVLSSGVAPERVNLNPLLAGGAEIEVIPPLSPLPPPSPQLQFYKPYCHILMALS